MQTKGTSDYTHRHALGVETTNCELYVCVSKREFERFAEIHIQDVQGNILFGASMLSDYTYDDSLEHLAKIALQSIDVWQPNI